MCYLFYNLIVSAHVNLSQSTLLFWLIKVLLFCDQKNKIIIGTLCTHRKKENRKRGIHYERHKANWRRDHTYADAKHMEIGHKA